MQYTLLLSDQKRFYFSCQRKTRKNITWYNHFDIYMYLLKVFFSHFSPPFFPFPPFSLLSPFFPICVGKTLKQYLYVDVYNTSGHQPPPQKKKNIYIFTYIIILSKSPPSAASSSYQTYQTYQSAFDRTRRTDWRADRHTDKQPDLHIAYWTVISVTWHTCLHGGSARMNFSVIWWMGERTDVTNTQTYSHYTYIHVIQITWSRDGTIHLWLHY